MTEPDHTPEPAVTDVASTESVAAAEEAKATGGQSSGWARLARMGKPRLTKANVLVTVLAMALGFALMTQVHQTRTGGLENLSSSELIALLDGVNQQSGKLNQEIDRLTRTRDALKSGGGDAAAIAAAQERLTNLQILAGTIPATGPGITMTIKDPSKVISAANVLDAVEELRDAGAEAIQIGNVRVVVDTWFGLTSDGRLIVDGHTLSPPYVITAIGDPHTMSTAMAIPGGVIATLAQQGVTASVSSSQSLTVTALRPASTPGYAQPDKSAS